MIKKIVSIIWSSTPITLRRKAVRISQKKFTASVAAIIINKKGEVLLLDHVLRAYSSWGIPGGFLDFAEQPEFAIRREIREETGLELEDVKFYSIRTINRHLEVLFLAKPIGIAEIKSHEIKDLGWFPVTNLPENMSGFQRLVIEDVLAKFE